MPELNIEEKIQEALKRKSFKDNKLEYLGLSLIFCLILFITFVIGYFLPAIAIFIFLLVDIPLIMGFKHFIWFGPASGETLMDGFKVSMICGYLNFVSYMKIFITTNLKPLLWAIVAFFAATVGGSFVLEGVLGNEINSIIEAVGAETEYVEVMNAFFENEAIRNGFIICEVVALVVGFITFYLLKLNRALLPYVSFLRLTNLEGKTMDGVLAHTKKVLTTRRFKYYLRATLYHLLYLIPLGLTAVVYIAISSNPVYSTTTLDLISSLVFFVTMFPALLFIELNNRNFCIEVNQEYLKEHKKMLNDAINDLNKNNRR